MTHDFQWGNNRLSLFFHWDDDAPVSIGRITSDDVDMRIDDNLPLVEIMAAGFGHWIACERLVSTSIGAGMRYVSHHSDKSENGINSLHVRMENRTAGLQADVTYQLPTNQTMFRTFVTVTNIGNRPISLESVTSWVSLFGSTPGEQQDASGWKLLHGAFAWLGENRWRSENTEDLFPQLSQELTGNNPRNEYKAISTGTWSTGHQAPLAVLCNKSHTATWIFQVEHNGAWRWEVGDYTVDGYMALSGPTNEDHSWSKCLAPGHTFTSVPASVTLASSFQSAYDSLIAYRRTFGTHVAKDQHPLVVFNDYMNTINGDPTTEKLLPLIDSAAEVGAQVFCIDCGWYDDSGDWWPSVGEWKPSTTRFPGGFAEVIDAIVSRGMVPGLWMEPEVVGVRSPIAAALPNAAFFQRNGRRVVEQDRYLLDFRADEARKYMDSVIDRLIGEFGIGYFKFDYNVSPGAGTDNQADSLGDGLLGHNRAYCDWLDALHERYPDLILENCSSGGMREDFMQTSHFRIQSTSDQQDYRLYPPIAVSSPMMTVPEQTANWAYPQASMSLEEIAFNLNTSMLGRLFISGFLNAMDEDRRNLIAQAVQTYKLHIQPIVSRAVPFWPMGLPGWTDKTLALGLRYDQSALVTVWARDPAGKESNVVLSLPDFADSAVDVHTIFPTGERFAPWKILWDQNNAKLRLQAPERRFTSRTILITRKEAQGQSRL